MKFMAIKNFFLILTVTLASTVVANSNRLHQFSDFVHQKRFARERLEQKISNKTLSISSIMKQLKSGKLTPIDIPENFYNYQSREWIAAEKHDFKSRGWTPLIWLARHCNDPDYEHLWDTFINNCSQLDAKTTEKMTALMMVASFSRSPTGERFLKKILTAKPNLNLGDQDGNTALMLAIFKGGKSLKNHPALTILAFEPNLSVRNKNSYTALMIAAHHCWLGRTPSEVIQKILEQSTYEQVALENRQGRNARTLTGAGCTAHKLLNDFMAPVETRRAKFHLYKSLIPKMVLFLTNYLRSNAAAPLANSSLTQCPLCDDTQLNSENRAIHQGAWLKYCTSCYKNNLLISDNPERLFEDSDYVEEPKGDDLKHLCLFNQKIRQIRENSSNYEDQLTQEATLLQQELRNIPGWTYCRGENCLNGKIIQKAEKHFFDCSICKFKGCLDCGEHHLGDTCAIYQQNQDLCDRLYKLGMVLNIEELHERFEDTKQWEITATDYENLSKYRPCYHCGILTERIEGCNLIRCGACKKPWHFNKGYAHPDSPHDTRLASARYVPLNQPTF